MWSMDFSQVSFFYHFYARSSQIQETSIHQRMRACGQRKDHSKLHSRESLQRVRKASLNFFFTNIWDWYRFAASKCDNWTWQAWRRKTRKYNSIRIKSSLNAEIFKQSEQLNESPATTKEERLYQMTRSSAAFAHCAGDGGNYSFTS